MIIFTIFISCAVVIGALAMHTIYTIIELKGYERGLDDAEDIIREVQDDKSTYIQETK